MRLDSSRSATSIRNKRWGPSRPATAQTERYVGTLRGQQQHRQKDTLESFVFSHVNLTTTLFVGIPGLTRRCLTKPSFSLRVRNSTHSQETIPDPRGRRAPSTGECDLRIPTLHFVYEKVIIIGL
ncbi:hypothetical protein AVEN_273138-1 [Araneus ventricosus]|uniref:Uncharacterized protein n=1 Tax=Araneus ventricosus TaxID=182803 RepID=A0A4Y2K9M8_ARAVE|nr:hypothetical protein AVEN_273138-1 [Araneus ventricosus]